MPTYLIVPIKKRDLDDNVSEDGKPDKKRLKDKDS
jgi:hypothetical protein